MGRRPKKSDEVSDLEGPRPSQPLSTYLHRPQLQRSSNKNPALSFPTKSSSRPLSRSRLAVRASSATVVPSHPPPGFSESGRFLERCLGVSHDAGPSTSSSAAAGEAGSGSPAVVMALPVMKKDYGAYGTVTLEKSKLDLSQKTTRSSPELATGGGGGDIGKKNFHGGGDGGDDGGDDDDYFGDFDEGDEGDDGGLFRSRLVLQELFDKKFVDAVLQEWSKTMVDLPAGLRQAYEMGLVSSAQMVRFLAINARSTVSRAISRAFPQSLSRAFVGRMLADPSFLYKFILEQAATIGCSVCWELKNRKERIKQEWDLALVNVLTATACNAIVAWSIAPCRSYGNTFRFDLQNSIQKLPNNIFEKSYPLREFDLQKRAYSFIYKAAEFSLLGTIAGAVQGELSKSFASKKGRVSVTIPSVSTNALGYGAFLGIYANMRYQLLCGIDRAMFNHFEVLGVVTVLRTSLRILNVEIGERSKRAWLGVDADPLVQSDNLALAYNRNSEAAADRPSSNWFISKNAIISGLGLLGIKQRTEESETTPKTRRRVVKRKIGRSVA